MGSSLRATVRSVWRLAVSVGILFAMSSGLAFGAPAGPGDVDGDGNIDPQDVALIEGHILWRAPLTGDELLRADANQDGAIDIADVVWTALHYSTSTPTASPTPSPTPSPSPSPSPTPSPSPSPTPITLTLTLPGDVPLKLVRIPSGTFQMGSPTTERSRYSNEGPVHTVTISRDFYMGRTEVTQRQWLAVMGGWPDPTLYPGNPTYPYGVGDDYPAYFISWNDICGTGGFLETLNQHLSNTGQGTIRVRLPTEAEWEYACRAGTQTRFFFGDALDPIGDSCEDGPAGTLPGNRSGYMWYCGNNTPNGSKPVGTRQPNPFVLYDMSGNVWEWCQDWYGTYPSSAQIDPAGPTSGSYRVGRGGHWPYDARYCRSAYRSRSTPVSRFLSVGFRLASPVQ